MSKYSENMPPELETPIEWFYELIKPGSSLLDLGCSTGYFGSLIKKDKNCIVDGVEISEDVNEAKKVLNNVYSFDLEGDWPAEILKKRYDYAFYGDVLEHLKDPAAALKKTAKILKKGAQLFVSIPNIAHLSVRLELMNGSFEYEQRGILDNTHLKYFTLSSFTNLAEEAGYRVVAVDYTVNEYPREVANALLKTAGLTPTNKFWAMAKSTEARANQYKFILEPITNKITKNLKKKKVAPIIKPEQYKTNFIEDLNSQITALHNHANEQAKIIEHKDRLITVLKRDLHNHQEQVKRIYNSIPGKLYKAAIRGKRSIIKKKN